MRIRSIAPLMALAAVLVALPASAATTTVTVQDFRFVAGSPTIAQGDQVDWNNKGDALHTATRTAFPAFSLELPAGAVAGRPFPQAGSFSYFCEIHPAMKGTVKVRVRTSPSSGTARTSFTITVGSFAAIPGSTYVIQRKAPGGSFRSWKTTTARSVTFKSSVKGTWSFRSKIVRTGTGTGSGYSPTASITIR